MKVNAIYLSVLSIGYQGVIIRIDENNDIYIGLNFYIDNGDTATTYFISHPDYTATPPDFVQEDRKSVV